MDDSFSAEMPVGEAQPEKWTALYRRLGVDAGAAIVMGRHAISHHLQTKGVPRDIAVAIAGEARSVVDEGAGTVTLTTPFVRFPLPPTCERCGAEGKRRGVLCGRCGW